MDVQIPYRIFNGIFNYTLLCEFYQGKLLLYLTMPFEEKPKTYLPCDNLKYYRQRKQMTTRQLAEKLDIAPVIVVMYENGKHHPLRCSYQTVRCFENRILLVL